MKEEQRHSGISMQGIRVGESIPGLIFTLCILFAFLEGSPELRLFLTLSMVVGGGVALALYLLRR